MSKPRIAIDIDEVLVPFCEELARHHNERYQTALQLEDFISHEYWKVWGGTKEESIEKVRVFITEGHTRHLSPMREAQEALNLLKKEFDPVVVTSRQRVYEDFTREWVETHFPNTFSAIHFCSYWDQVPPFFTKAEVCKEIGAIVLVDDHIQYVLECAAQGLPSILFGNYPWNQTDVLPEKVTRAANWTETCKLLLNHYIHAA